MTIKEVSEKFGISADALRYYERVGMIPEVNRTSGGKRDYTEQDVRWVQLALCMRRAGLPVDVMVEYLKLYMAGDGTIPERLELLKKQKEILVEQRMNIEMTIDRLNYKIAKYETAVETGKLSWD